MPATDRPMSFFKLRQRPLSKSTWFVLLPAFCLAIYWTFGEAGLIAAAVGLPLAWVLYGGSTQSRQTTRAHPQAVDGVSKLDARDADKAQLETYINDMLFDAKTNERFAVFCIEVDSAKEVARRLGSNGLQDIQQRLQMRYASCLRSTDVVFQSGQLHWTVAFKPGRNLDLEAVIQQASRLQEIADEPLFVGDDRLYLSTSIGFTFAQKPFEAAHKLVSQAQTALGDAILNGPDSIRAYSPRSSLSASPDLKSTLEDLNGDIETSLVAWFQPQISTDTGKISGFEALARWQDRDGQWYSPATVLPILEQNGLMDQLTDIVLTQSLRALAMWDEEELNIATIGVNFSECDLANPRLYEKVAWDLDRFNIAPERLCVEVLESVIAGEADDMIVRNVTRLAELGCQIDLDDFGTGHSSISTLRRLPVHRLKIDRSFVTKADLDPEQQKMVATILMMAERLELSCLAEGVETLGEQSILAQLGCRYVQGYGIAKPMPFEETLEWIENFQAQQLMPPQIGRKSS